MNSAAASITTRVLKRSSVQLSPSPLPAAHDALIVRLADEMAAAWRDNQRPPAEYYLDRHPALRQWPSEILDLG
jgi:hypothetical protein